MKILVTGHVGFVGSHFTKYLLANGHEVTGVDTRLKKPDWMRHWLLTSNRFDYVVDDIRRYMTIQPCDQFDLIIHCAATVGGRLNMENNPLAIATNLSIDSEFFSWISKGKKKKRVVYFSSSAIYPPELQTRRSHVALHEAHVNFDVNRFAMPETTYGFAKFAGEYLAKIAVEKFGCEVVIYRPFGGYGEGQDLTYPFPSIIKRVADHENPIVVWGSGEQMRDFIHIDDIVEGVMSTYDKVPAGTTLNLGTGKATSFIKLAQLAREAAGYTAKIEPDFDKPEGVFCRVADTYELEQWYKPKISLKEGIERALTVAKVSDVV